MYTHNCKRCVKPFESKLEDPSVCKNCRSPLWNVERKRKPGSGRPRKTPVVSAPVAEPSPATDSNFDKLVHQGDFAKVIEAIIEESRTMEPIEE